MNYHRIAFLFTIGILSFVIWSCVDVNNSNIPSNINYHSLVRFINVAGDNPAAGAITVDNAPVGTITYGNSTAYMSLLSGSRTLAYGGNNQLLNFVTDDQITIVVHTLNGTDRFLLLDEGYSFKNNGAGMTDTTQIKFINSAVGFAPSMIFRTDSLTGTTVAVGVPFNRAEGYVILPSGSYPLFALSNGGYLATIDGSQEIPAVTTGSSGSGTFGLAYDTGLSWSIDVTTANTGGVNGTFYSVANFHLGAPGVSGAAIQGIDVSGQTVSFPDGKFNTPDTLTRASGTTSGVVLSSNAARDSFSVNYTISVVADPTDTLQVVSTFLSAAFHRGSPSGPVLRDIAIGPFRDSTITGTWSTADAQPLTRALVDTLLNGRVYITFTTPRHVTGELYLQLVPDPTTTNTYAGAWAGISEAMKDSIVAGKVYMNFETLTNPTGQIRGQLTVDPAAGQYGIASLPAATYGAGSMYTVIAADSGSVNLKLLPLQNRQAGVTTSAKQQILPVLNAPKKSLK